MLNWDTIQYIFQIPLRWYRYIHNCCFKSYGGNLIQITDQGDGTKEISVPQEEFEAAVKSLAKVKTVDLIEPNDDGDVDF